MAHWLNKVTAFRRSRFQHPLHFFRLFITDSISAVRIKIVLFFLFDPELVDIFELKIQAFFFFSSFFFLNLFSNSL